MQSCQNTSSKLFPPTLITRGIFGGMRAADRLQIQSCVIVSSFIMILSWVWVVFSYWLYWDIHQCQNVWSAFAYYYYYHWCRYKGCICICYDDAWWTSDYHCYARYQNQKYLNKLFIWKTPKSELLETFQLFSRPHFSLPKIWLYTQ